MVWEEVVEVEGVGGMDHQCAVEEDTDRHPGMGLRCHPEERSEALTVDALVATRLTDPQLSRNALAKLGLHDVDCYKFIGDHTFTLTTQARRYGSGS